MLHRQPYTSPDPMRPRIPLSRCGLLVAFALGLSCLGIGQPSPQWRRDLTSALQDAQASKKVAMIDFYADWCALCRRFDSETYSDAEVIRLAEQFVAVRQDTEKEGKAAAARYQVEDLPAILFVDGDGKVIARLNRFQPPKSFAATMRRVLDSQSISALEERLKSAAEDLEAIASLGGAYATVGNWKGAMEMGDRAWSLDPKNSNERFAGMYNAIGDLFRATKPFVAMECYNRASMSRDPDTAAYALIGMGSCYLALRMPEPALAIAKRAASVRGISRGDLQLVEELRGNAQSMAKTLEAIRG